MNKKNSFAVIFLASLFLFLCIAGIYGGEPAYAATDLNSFPESYRTYIQQMISKHPNWNFVAYETGVSWKELQNYENGYGVNLVENTNPEAWFAKGEQYYDPATGKYTVISAPNWVQASSSLVDYFLDPRNFLNENDVFMFKRLSYNSAYHTEGAVEAILSGTWMYQSKLEDDSSMTYAQAFVRIGKEIGISPFLLASRVVQEQGSRGTSPLISGTYSGFEGYYNYFNINASGTTYEQIYRNGLTEAKEAGWNTRYKSLYGGAQKISSNYIKRGQNTLYFQKFDVVDGLSWHQYMQNIQAPYSEGRKIRSAYEKCGLLESAFTFVIPVYTGMPSEACPLPDDNDDVTLSMSASASGYQIKAEHVSAASANVRFQVWSESGGMDDLKTYSATKTDRNTWTLSWSVGNHDQQAGLYHVEMFVTDEYGTTKSVATTTFQVNAPSVAQPSVSTDSANGTIRLSVPAAISQTSVSTVRAAVWTEANNQDDLKWYNCTRNTDGSYTIDLDIANHNNERGVYMIHVYVSDAGGFDLHAASVVTSMPELPNASVSMSLNGQSLYVDAQNVQGTKGVASVRIAVWNVGVTSPTWYRPALINGHWVLNVDLADHGLQNGLYAAHVYVTDKNGYERFAGEAKLTLEGSTNGSVTTLGFTVPDANLLQSLAQAGADANGDGVITIPEMQALTAFTLDGSATEIFSFEGLEYATGLNELHLKNYPEFDVDLLSAMPSLKILSLLNCDITDLSFTARLPQLTRLNIADNPISAQEAFVQYAVPSKCLVLGDQISIQDLIPVDLLDGAEIVYRTGDQSVISADEHGFTAVGLGVTLVYVEYEGTTRAIAVEVESDLLLGDVNEDGLIDATDALLVLRHAAGLIQLQDRGLTAADCNQDGFVDAADALKILRIAANLE